MREEGFLMIPFFKKGLKDHKGGTSSFFSLLASMVGLSGDGRALIQSSGENHDGEKFS